MRILQIRFKNLNSLVGEWAIDFTHPAFTSDGIFAITGPTGAGKSTILDAICLALYGQTPRLNKITKSGNEIMSRQTGECFAEVSFESQAGRFRCYWSQHRARKKPGGDLQSPKHEMVDADSDTILQSSLRGVAGQIEAVTGMDFERFTRSMLLAQGGFDSFLKADSDRRAPVLEQITGTGIYSQISIRVHEMRLKERKKLDMLLAELDGMPLLSEEDEKQLSASLTQKRGQETELSQQIVKTNQALAWLDGIAGLEQDLLSVEAKQRDWLSRQETFQPEREKLQQATQALELAGEHAELRALRREQTTEQQKQVEYLTLLPTQEAAVKRDEEIVRLAAQTLEQNKLEQKEARPIIRKARELDLKLREKEAPVKAARDAISEQDKSLDVLRANYDDDCMILANKNKAFDDVLKYLDETRVDEGLVEHLAGIRHRFGVLKNIHDQQSSKVDKLKTTEVLVIETNRVWNEHVKNAEAQQRELDVIQSLLGQKQLELTNTLEDKALSDWRTSLAALKEKKPLLEKVSEAHQTLVDSRDSFNKLGTRHDELTADSVKLAGQYQTQVEKHTALEKEVNLLETQLTLLKTIQSFDEARHQLQDGKECPLCGSREHPFAEGNIPLADETIATLHTARADREAANDIVADLKIKQAGIDKDREQVVARKQECSDKIAASESLIKQNGILLSIDVSGPALAEVLSSLQQVTKDDLDHSEKIVFAAEALEKDITAQRELFDKTKEAVAVSARETQSATHQRDTAQQALERLRAEAGALDAQFHTAQDDVQQEISVYGIETLSSDYLDQIQIELTVRRERWLARSKEKLELEQAISTLVIQTDYQNEQIKKSVAEMTTLREQLGKLQSEQDGLNRERHDLFGDKNPDEEESRLSVILEAAEKNLNAAHQALNTAIQEHGKLKHSIENLEKSLAVRTTQLQEREETFLTRLGVSGCVDEARYVAACLPEDERKQLMEQAQALTNEQTELTSKAHDKKTQLETERQKKITDQAREEIDLKLAGFIANQKDLQQEVGGISQKLKDNDNLKLTQQERGKAIDAQKRESLRWDLLHELIGSADGKKFRNFAQGLTFEMMVGHANRQLQKMSERYLLIRDEAQPLELNVVDNYQAGEIRSTRNLSGGESFIVSLSLALGLSHMASKNVRVDSLFLDEGFGTLDEEALETALETLAGLQQDGKLIGVISHVPALKERISTQIQINPQTGGRSVISGPGCEKNTRSD